MFSQVFCSKLHQGLHLAILRMFVTWSTHTYSYTLMSIQPSWLGSANLCALTEKLAFNPWETLRGERTVFEGLLVLKAREIDLRTFMTTHTHSLISIQPNWLGNIMLTHFSCKISLDHWRPYKVIGLFSRSTLACSPALFPERKREPGNTWGVGYKAVNFHYVIVLVISYQMIYDFWTAMCTWKNGTWIYHSKSSRMAQKSPS